MAPVSEGRQAWHLCNVKNEVKWVVYYSLLFIVYYLYYILFQKGLKEAGLLQYNLTECQAELLRPSPQGHWPRETLVEDHRSFGGRRDTKKAVLSCPTSGEKHRWEGCSRRKLAEAGKANSQVQYPPSFTPLVLTASKGSGLLQSVLLGLGSPLHGEWPDSSVFERPTASCRVQALPLHHPPPPHLTVPRGCLLPHHLDLDCADWMTRRTRRRSGMSSCLAWVPAGSAPLEGCPLLPREKGWSGPHTGL